MNTLAIIAAASLTAANLQGAIQSRAPQYAPTPVPVVETTHTPAPQHKEFTLARWDGPQIRVAPAPTLPAPSGSFSDCAENFYKGKPPAVNGSGLRALCFSGFAVLHSAQTKTPLFAAAKLNRERLDRARGLQRTDRFFEDARLPRQERAELEDYQGSGLDRGHNIPAADMDTPAGMAQSFSLANMMPQAPENNRGAWSLVEQSTRKYVMRAQGDVFVITGSVSLPGACPIDTLPKKPRHYDAVECTIGKGKVKVPTHLYKLVFDPNTERAWAHWLPNTNDARIGKPITYAELVRRTGIDFLPGAHIKP